MGCIGRVERRSRKTVGMPGEEDGRLVASVHWLVIATCRDRSSLPRRVVRPDEISGRESVVDRCRTDPEVEGLSWNRGEEEHAAVIVVVDVMGPPAQGTGAGVAV